MDTAKTNSRSSVSLREGHADDAPPLGAICYKAFKTISAAHNFPADFPSAEAATGLIANLLAQPGVYSVVAESENQLVGSNFLWEADTVAGVGPITVDPQVQNSAIGRALMNAVIERADADGKVSVRLVQAAFHNRSLSLYTKLGFNTAEPLSNIQGPRLNTKIKGYDVRKMTKADLPVVNSLSRCIHGHDRAVEVSAAVDRGSARIVEHDGRITGYATLVGFFGHAVGESNEELKALIGAAESFPGSGFLLPTRNSELLRWCLSSGLKIVQPLTLMARGLYQEPRGAFLPSILY